MKTLTFYRKTPRKTRIKVVEKRNGDIEYVAQYRDCFLWFPFDDFDAWNPLSLDVFHPYHAQYNSLGLVRSTNLDKVKLVIDDYIKLVEEAVQKKHGDEVVNKAYIDYP